MSSQSARSARHGLLPPDVPGPWQATDETDLPRFLADTIVPAADAWPERAVDLGCGRRLADPVWQALFAAIGPEELDYEGFDVCPARPAGAVPVPMPGETRNRRRLGTTLEVLPRLETDGYATVLALDGVIMHAPDTQTPRILAELHRITTGCLVLGFPLDAGCTRTNQRAPRGRQPHAVQVLLQNAGFEVVATRAFIGPRNGTTLVTIATLH